MNRRHVPLVLALGLSLLLHAAAALVWRGLLPLPIGLNCCVVRW